MHLSKTVKIVAVGLVLAVVGYFLFDSLMGLILGLLASAGGAKDMQDKIQQSKTLSKEADRRQKDHSRKADKHAQDAEDSHDKALDAAEDITEPQDQDLPDGFRRGPGIKSR